MSGGRLTGDGRRSARWAPPHDEFISDYEAHLAELNRYENYNSSTAYNYGAPDELKVYGIDFFIKDNATAHHTNEFDITNALWYNRREMLVVRRGQQFTMKITFNRTFDAAKDVVRLILQFGNRPLPSRQSHIELSLSANSTPDAKRWGVNIQSQEGNSVTLYVAASSTCAVGKWSLKIDVVKPDEKYKSSVLRYGITDPIYILFNPWCKDDQVYMKDEDLLQEYILNENGRLYGGSSEKITSIPWNFGQFSDTVFDCVMYLLDVKSGLPDQLRGDPVHVSRKISSLVNSNDENGVVFGNWSGDYSGGTSPLRWTGSVEILEEYYRTKRPVKYGQCWVFAGVVTTVCRVLGIPARGVTNYLSAHDTDGSITIDTYFNRYHGEITELNEDSVWNFHVWNDVWMTRPDLPPGYDGWQAIDATPQEASGGIFRAGPMSLKAIKQGDVHLPYDGPFIFAEVNADKIMWMSYSPGDLRIVKKEKDKIGKFISTKKPLAKSTMDTWLNSADIDRVDITDEYKFQEGSAAERNAVHKASQYSTLDDVYDSDKKDDDVEFELTADNNTFIGEPLKVFLRVKNLSKEQRTIGGNIRITTSYYTGISYKEVVKGRLQRTELNGNAEKSYRMEIPANYYMDKLMDHYFFHITCSCMVEETDQSFADTLDVRLRKPHLNIEAPDTGYIGQAFRAKVSFLNPLSVALTNCEIRIEGPGKQRPSTHKLNVVIYPGRTFRCLVELTPAKEGQKEIILNFSCAQLSSINASHPIYITR